MPNITKEGCMGIKVERDTDRLLTVCPGCGNTVVWLSYKYWGPRRQLDDGFGHKEERFINKVCDALYDMDEETPGSFVTVTSIPDEIIARTLEALNSL
jgi:hypothetical protein